MYWPPTMVGKKDRHENYFSSYSLLELVLLLANGNTVKAELRSM
jgi:hypothetical protein